jgi:hypothetical protein
MAKQQRVKIPKTVAGVKLKKKTRKGLGSALGLLSHPESRELLGLAAGSVIGYLAKRREKKTKHA